MPGTKTVVDVDYNSNRIISLAIIIPTLNEERFIGRLLDSILRQTVVPKELVVVDACSKDRTVDEIKKRQKNFPALRFFRVPKSTISHQRNLGAKKTASPHLLFLDADMEFRERDALEKYFREIVNKKPDVATATTLPDSSTWKNRIYFKAEDLFFKASRYIWLVITARNLYVKREIFNKIGGFDEELAVGEDQELVQRIRQRGGKFIFLKTVKLHTSVRRVEQEGRRKYVLKMFMYGLNVLLHGRKKSKVQYEFGKFKDL